MKLIDEFQAQGNWLFRWRSYLPFVMVALIALALLQFDWPFNSMRFHGIWENICLSVSFAGLVVRVITVGFAPAATSGRNTKTQIAAELNTNGMYSIVRHPLYLGNFLIGLGVASVLFVWWLPVIYVLMFWLYYERIMFAEEAFLREKFGRVFDDWADVTPAFVPAPSKWRSPELKFSVRNVLGREYTAMMVIVLGHTGIEFFEYIRMFGTLGWTPFWVAFSIGGSSVYLLLRELKRRTKLLDAPGR